MHVLCSLVWEKTDYQDDKMTRRNIFIDSICKSNQRVQAGVEAE